VALSGGAATLGVVPVEPSESGTEASCGAYNEAPKLAHQSGVSGDKH
jgi:hypothetical protein